MTVRILEGDCVELMRTLPEASVDAIVTDPPYDLTAGRKGGTGDASYNPRTPAGRARIGAGGFMGQKWDATGVAFRAETWAEVLRVLKPGGHLLAFGGTRTSHRMVCAIEDAGFEIRDGLGWLYGNGFPKATDKGKIPEAWRGWNTALKPAMEPICLARKAMQGTLAANLERWGTGALWIDGCRITVEDAAYARNHSGDRGHAGTRDSIDTGATSIRAGGGSASDLGRWPANVLHDGSEEVLAAFPAETGTSSGGNTGRKSAGILGAYKGLGGGEAGFGDSGSAARFFYCSKATRADRNEGLADPGPQFSMGRLPHDAEKVIAAGKGNHHPTVKPTELMRYLCRLVTPPGGTVLDPFMGSGSTLKAAELEGFSAIGIELDQGYVEIARRRIAGDVPLFAEVAA